MSFHPEKCSILRVHRKDAPVMFDYSLKGHTLICEESTRYLGAFTRHVMETARRQDHGKRQQYPSCEEIFE